MIWSFDIIADKSISAVFTNTGIIIGLPSVSVISLVSPKCTKPSLRNLFNPAIPPLVISPCVDNFPPIGIFAEIPFINCCFSSFVNEFLLEVLKWTE